jgi:hypothetical protein
MPTDQFLTVSPFWRMLLGVAGSLLLIYGLGLLILPDPVSDSFPWVLDEFHSRLYSATFIAGGAALLTVALKTLPIEFIAAGSAEAAVGLLAILGLVIVDQKADRIDWSATDTRGWLAMFAALLILGVMMIANGIRQIRAQSR